MPDYHLSFESPVRAEFESVVRRFDIRLFRALCPPFPQVRIIRFDGIETGSLVQLQLNFFLFRWNWSGSVVSYRKSADELKFVDEGNELPPFLASWKHTHTVLKTGTTSIIRDKISYSPAAGWPSFLVRWMIKIQMKPRRKIYQRFFESL